MRRKMEAEKFVLPQPHRKVLLTIGETWAELVAKELKANEAQYLDTCHVNMGNPQYQLSRHDHLRFASVQTRMREFLSQNPSMEAATQALQQEVNRFNGKSIQASEIVFRYTVAVSWADVICLDNSILDTSIGQFVLMEGVRNNKPVWAIGVDARLAAISPAFLRGVLFPTDAREILKTVL